MQVDIRRAFGEVSFIPDACTGEAQLTSGAYEVTLDAADVHMLCDCLRAHMPDRMRPLTS